MQRRKKLLIGTALLIFVIISPFCFGFLAGVTEAGQTGHWPNSLNSYCAFARTAEGLPIIGRVVRAGNSMGYAFADGPETTR